MAISFDCSHCQAHFSVADSLAGRKAKCTRCGQAIQIPKPAVKLDDDGLIALADEPAAEARHTVAPPPPPFPTAASDRKGKAKSARPRPARASPPVPPGQVISAPAQQAVVLDHAPPPGLVLRDDGTYGIARRFWPDLGHSFIYIARGRGPFLFGILVLLFGIRAFLQAVPTGGYGLVPQFIIAGWLCAYYFEIIVHTCSGEDELPLFSMESGILDDIVFPFLKFLASYLWVMLPLIAWIAAMVYLGRTEPFLFGIPSLIPSEPRDQWIAIGLLLLGLLLWPITALSIAVNGCTVDAIRYDRQLVTIARAPGGYLAVCLLLVAAAAILVAGSVSAAVTGALLGGGLGAALLVGLLTSFVGAYAAVVCMRAIGLFYRHYKDRFAWAAE